MAYRSDRKPGQPSERPRRHSLIFSAGPRSGIPSGPAASTMAASTGRTEVCTRPTPHYRFCTCIAGAIHRSRSWPTPRLLNAAIYSGEAPTGGLLWLADLEEARPTDLQGSSEAAFAGEDSIGLKVLPATRQPYSNSQNLPSCSLRPIYYR